MTLKTRVRHGIVNGGLITRARVEGVGRNLKIRISLRTIARAECEGPVSIDESRAIEGNSHFQGIPSLTCLAGWMQLVVGNQITKMRETRGIRAEICTASISASMSARK